MKPRYQHDCDSCQFLATIYYPAPHYNSDAAEDTYMHVSDVRQFVKDNPAQAKECGEFDDMESASEYLNGNWPF